MRQVLKTYELLLEVRGPVFIGSGNEIQKKEYVFLKGDKVGIVDIGKLYLLIKKLHLAAEYEKYMAEVRGEDLRKWLERNRIPMSEVMKCMKYTLESGDMVIERGKRLQIMEFIKDAYGKPYVPGSSVKGMLRTILLGGEIIRHPERYREEAGQLASDLRLVRGRDRKALGRNISAIENKRFHVLKRTDHIRDAVNDMMSGIIVSDSEPLETKDLVLCQKVEQHTDGSEKTLNLLRECLRPETRVRCDLTIDESVTKLSTEQLREDIAVFGRQYYDNFGRKFPGADRTENDIVFLGGGSGFVSKTVVYPLIPGRDGVRVTKEIFEKTGVPREHKHDRDIQYGVSPHILKCTRYQGKSLQMGLCKIKIHPKEEVSRAGLK